MRKLIVAVTGTPGTGKSEFAKRLAKGLGSCAVIEINDVAKRLGLFTGIDKFGSSIVDINRLNAAVRAEVRRTGKKTVLVVGHLVPDLKMNQDITVVLRLGLKALEARLSGRGYPKEKIRENLISEAVDYCGENSRISCDRTYEAETESERKRIISYIQSLSKGARAPEPSRKSHEKLRELIGLIGNGNKYGL